MVKVDCDLFATAISCIALLLSSRKVLVLVLEDQFTSPCPRTSSPCPCPRALSPRTLSPRQHHCCIAICLVLVTYLLPPLHYLYIAATTTLHYLYIAATTTLHYTTLAVYCCHHYTTLSIYCRHHYTTPVSYTHLTLPTIYSV